MRTTRCWSSPASFPPTPRAGSSWAPASSPRRPRNPRQRLPPRPRLNQPLRLLPYWNPRPHRSRHPRLGRSSRPHRSQHPHPRRSPRPPHLQQLNPTQAQATIPTRGRELAKTAPAPTEMCPGQVPTRAPLESPSPIQATIRPLPNRPIPQTRITLRPLKPAPRLRLPFPAPLWTLLSLRLGLQPSTTPLLRRKASLPTPFLNLSRHSLHS